MWVAYGFLLAAWLIANVAVWRLSRAARLGLRREYRLVLILAAIDRARTGNGAGAQAVMAAQAELVAELERQNDSRPWHRIPPVEEAW